MLPVSLSCTGPAFALVGRPRNPHLHINTPDAPASLRGGASCIHGPWVGGLSLGLIRGPLRLRGNNWGFFMALTD